MELREVLDFIILNFDCALEIAEIFEEFSRDAPNLLTGNHLNLLMGLKEIE